MLPTPDKCLTAIGHPSPLNHFQFFFLGHGFLDFIYLFSPQVKSSIKKLQKKILDRQHFFLHLILFFFFFPEIHLILESIKNLEWNDYLVISMQSVQ